MEATLSRQVSEDIPEHKGSQPGGDLGEVVAYGHGAKASGFEHAFPAISVTGFLIVTLYHLPFC